jgi:hypothetical protein
MPSNQSYHYCSSKGSEEGYLFEAIKNPRWLYWPLVGRYIFDFFSRTTACEASRLNRNDPQEVLKKSYSFSERFEIQHGCPSCRRHFLIISKTTSFEEFNLFNEQRKITLIS